jgi:hypothetical protein
MTPSISRPSTASTIEDIQTRLSALEQRHDTRFTHPAPLQRKTDAPELLDSTSYFAFRNHVFATFRAKVKPLSPADTKALAEADHVFSVHAGDPLFDAVMFRKGIRTDDRTFCLLYGMPWARVLEFVMSRCCF